MGTKIYNEDDVHFVNRYNGGIDKGLMFSIRINKDMTQKEFTDFLNKCQKNLMP